MQLLPSIEGTIPQQIARDMALLHAGEEVLRFWEPVDQVAVVLGRGNLREEWVNVEACDADGVPILRRESGGGAVVLAPGCLNYSLVFSLERRPAWREVSRSFADILQCMADALMLEFREPCDLALRERKVSGSAQRRTPTALLHHGTFLHEFDPALAERYLLQPKRQPQYRKGRNHADFLANVELPPQEIGSRVAQAWGLGQTTRSAPRPRAADQLSPT